MLIYNGVNWEIPKMKVKYTLEIEEYTNTKEGYPENAVFEDIILTDEQQENLDRLNETKDNNISIEEATDYVFNREPVDNRTNEEKLIEIILELDPSRVGDNLVQDVIRDWEPGVAYDRFVFVRDDGIIYKTVHPIRTFEEGRPKDRPELYSRVGGKDEETGLEEIVPDTNHINSYSKGFIGVYQGRVYMSNYDSNFNEPKPGGLADHWWLDLGTVEEYLANLKG